MLSAYDFSFTKINGEKLDLADFAGRPILVVNTASHCEFTGQYNNLQKIWKQFQHKGLMVIGVPSNDFGNQEPGDEHEILAFCEKEYNIDFPLTRKEHVVGERAHPFYQWVESQAKRPRWNFHKYLVGKNGALLYSWSAMTRPTSARVLSAIEQLTIKG